MKIDFKNKKIIILAILMLLLVPLLSAGIYFYLLKNKPEELEHSSCLLLTEEVQYQAFKNEDGSGSAKISIKDGSTNEIIFEFQIDNIFLNHYHPYETHQCGIYLVREFNFDYKRGKPLSDFRMEVWRYRYDGSGEKLVEESDFRVDPGETYLALEHGYLGGPDYALIIKNLEDKNDVFVLQFKDLIAKYPFLMDGVGLREWTKDSRYYWGETFIGAYVLGFFRIDTTNWKVEVFRIPEGVLGGSALNIEKGYVTRHPGHVWTGIDIATEQIEQEWREEGKISSLYLYNLFTKEQDLIATTSEPLWFFKPKWISDTELEYELPSGEKKVYNIEERK